MNDLDRELDAALAALRDEVLPESALASVRAGVREGIEVRRRRRVWTAWLSLAAAAAAIGVAVVIPWSVATLPLKTPRPPEVASIALARPARVESCKSFDKSGAPFWGRLSACAGPSVPPVAVPPEEALLKPGRSLKAAPPRGALSRSTSIGKVRGRVIDSPTETAREEQTQFMRIITDDPNVVILWAMNSKGETR